MKPMSHANRRRVMAALKEQALTPPEIAALIGESVARITNWLNTRRRDHNDVFVEEWRHIEGTSKGSAMWRAGEGENAPYPKGEFQRLGDTQMEAKARAADLARQRATIPKQPARDPVVAALFGPYRGSTSQGASAQ
ncbi:hypothetical protein GCM10007242_16840 [Pigmentiphaga litoralis]|uniref:hypothetical protein n=1 Tax=Pigmentiphaga litoralis TaxID=516702 RepID=UPI0016772273|nr:hypothetical protein [Pigmentiphaga litoralis]GGX11359.1 hypothetical protein GCM10007242_16840 [Pigmentiphaga litoralis]